MAVLPPSCTNKNGWFCSLPHAFFLDLGERPLIFGALLEAVCMAPQKYRYPDSFMRTRLETATLACGLFRRKNWVALSR